MWEEFQEPTHYNLLTGKPCSCAWGEPKKGKSRRTSSVNLRRIRKQDQKIFRDENGKAYLDALEHYAETHPEIEPLIPWLAARYKRDEFVVDPQYAEPTIIATHRGNRLERFLPRWVQWMNARNHPLRRGRNIMEMSASELDSVAQELQRDVDERQKKERWVQAHGNTGLHAFHFSPEAADPSAFPHISFGSGAPEGFATCPNCHWTSELRDGKCENCGVPLNVEDPDEANLKFQTDLLNKYTGWTVRQLNNRRDCEAETEALGHCIGLDNQPYKEAIDGGYAEAYSLRDPQGYPHVTWHFNPDGTLAHLQGSSGSPKEDYRHLISLYHHHADKHDDDGGHGYEDLDALQDYQYDTEVHLPDPESVETYHEQYHPDANYYDWAGDYAERGIGENTEVHTGDPAWASIYEDLKEQDPETRHNFYHMVLYNGQHRAFQDEIEANVRRHDKDEMDDLIAQEFNQAFQRSHNQRGQFQTPHFNWVKPGWETAWDEINQPLFTNPQYPPQPDQRVPNYVNNRGVVFPDPETMGNRINPDWGSYTDMTAQEPSEIQYQTCPQCGTHWDAQQNYQYCPRCNTPVQGRTANILDPIHDTLPPEVWDNPGDPRPKLKRQHRQWILREVYALAAKFEPNPDMWLRLVFTGSLTTYQYSPESDVDISLFVDEFKLPEWDRGRLIGLMVENMDGVKLPGTPYEMQCFVVPKGIQPADLYQPGLRSGYDLQSESWIVPPDRSRVRDVQREQNADYMYALESADKMERLLRYEPEKAIKFWHQIHNRRRRDHKAGKGDFSQANIVYKFLANRGLFPRIAELTGEYIAGYNPRMAITTEWGQDWDEWNATRPSYAEPGHQLGWKPGIHPEGKGFILDDGSVWTWPTKDMRPIHMNYDAKAKALGRKLVPGTAFHIDADGRVFFIGEGRGFNPEQAELVAQADPALKPTAPTKRTLNPFA